MFKGLLESGFLYLKYDEDVHEGMRLGRNMWLQKLKGQHSYLFTGAGAGASL